MPPVTKTRTTRFTAKSKTEAPDELASTLSTKLTISSAKAKEKASQKVLVATPDDLAADLVTKLTISKPKGKAKASLLSLEDRRTNAMRAVNAASRNLSTVIDSGWRAKQKGRSESSVVTYASAAKKGLDTLRELSPREVDIERAASAVIGKLVALEMYDTAIPVLTDMRQALIALYHSDYQSPSRLPDFHYISLPLVDTEIPEPILTLISTYLVHSTTIYCQPKLDLGALSDALDASPTLLAWAPHLTCLPEKQYDYVLTRAYTVIATCASSPGLAPQTAYRLRTYALLCLAHTRPSVIVPKAFWDQAIKFAATLVASERDGEDRSQCAVAEYVLASYERLITGVGGRPDRVAFMSGTGFVAFCEYWIACAKEAGDIRALDRVTRMMGGTGQDHVGDVGRELFALEGTKTCAALAQALAVFDKWDECASDRASRMLDTEVVIARCQRFLGEVGDAEQKRTADKVWRALERLRRCAVKICESSSSSEVKTAAKSLLEKIAGVLADVVRETHVLNADTVTPALDTLFVLARTSLLVANPDTYAYAFSSLARASMLVSGLNSSIKSADAMESCANYVRCVSGAFHHLAGVLYQANRYSHTVRFLNEGCVLGNRALEMYREAKRGGAGAGNHEDAWKQLEEQLYRRWELLGVCQAKTGDRRLAFDAFVESIRTFPFPQRAFVQATRTTPYQLFDASSSLKQISSVLDRTTYMGTCDLFMEPEKLSAKSWLEESVLGGAGGDCTERAQTWNCVVGALLERQIEGLESSRWKPGVSAVIDILLHHALEVYSPADRPVRRARVLLKSLEHSYYTPVETPASTTALSSDKLAEEALELLECENASYDNGLTQFRTQYLVMTHLYTALHAHCRAGDNHIRVVLSSAEQACRILKSMLPSAPRQSLPKIQSPRAIPVPQKKPAGRVGTRGAPPKTRTTKAPRQARPVTPKPRKGALNDVPLNTVFVTPSRPTVTHHKPATVFDNFQKFFSLLSMTSHMVGLLGHIFMKIQLLVAARKLSEQHIGATSDEYMMSSLELAHEYVKLGRIGKAANIYHQALAAVRSGEASAEARVMFLLRYAEALAAAGNVLKSATTYCEALALSEDLCGEEKGTSTAERVRLRVAVLERAAVAASTFSVMQYSRDDPNTSLDGLLQSLRLWNRAVDTMARLRPTPQPKSTEESNPFEVAEPTQSAKDSEGQPSEQVAPRRTFQQRSSLDSAEWRVADGLMDTLLCLAQGYFARGSPREAEYFAQQAYDFASSLNAPAMISRALARKGEILLHLGQLEKAHSSLMQAADLVADIAGTDAADIHRLRGHYNQLNAQHQDAQELYEQSLAMLDELGKLFMTYDGATNGLRKSLSVSPRSARTQSSQDSLAPALLAAVLRQQIGLLHDAGSEYKTLLDRFASLPPTAETKAEHSALMAKLTLDDVYSRFRADMFLSSLAESAITIPMGMSAERAVTLTPTTQDILGTLTTAEKMFWSDLVSISRRGNVPHVRGAAISLALIRTLQTSLGKGGSDAAVLAAHLIDASTAITLHREMLEAIQQKFRDPLSFDDLRWPLVTPNGSPLPPVQVRGPQRGSLSFSDSEDEREDIADDAPLQNYWTEVQKKYQSTILDAQSMSVSRAHLLPPHWTVVNISVTEDKSTMFVTRQRANQSPLIFCLPLKGRRDSQDDEHLGFDDAVSELKEIIRLSDEGTRGAANVKKDDKRARATWWAERTALDKRLQELLENIEFCWLGAFKTIFSQPMHITAEDLSALRSRLDKVFERSLLLQDKKSSRRRKTRVRLDDTLTECFAALPADCRDEELEDVVYFVLDLYQFHGVPVAVAEVDIDQVCIDLRSALEEHAARTKSGTPKGLDDTHMFLVLDKNVQGIPWESLPALRGRSVSRIPSLDFLLDRLQLARLQRGDAQDDTTAIDRAVVDPRKTYYVLNPSGDLRNTEGRFAGWLQGMKAVGWKGVTGRAPSEQQLVDALARNDLVIYFGHGGAEQYVRSHKIRHLPRCAATMLWGCSSGALKEMGDFDRVGTPYNYMLAGCPTLVANLWDVTDRDIDKFSQAVFDDLRLTAAEVKHWKPREGAEPSDAGGGMSAVRAVAKARQCCKLKYLTGAAPVVYGIPFYI